MYLHIHMLLRHGHCPISVLCYNASNSFVYLLYTDKRCRAFSLRIFRGLWLDAPNPASSPIPFYFLSFVMLSRCSLIFSTCIHASWKCHLCLRNCVMSSVFLFSVFLFEFIAVMFLLPLFVRHCLCPASGLKQGFRNGINS